MKQETKSKAECYWCEKEFEYTDGSEFEQWSEDYDFNTIIYFVVVCPHCQSLTKVY